MLFFWTIQGVRKLSLEHGILAQKTIRVSCINMNEMFNKKHVVSMRDLTREDVEFILDCAERMMPYAKSGMRVLQNRTRALRSFDPRTRTPPSCDTATKR